MCVYQYKDNSSHSFSYMVGIYCLEYKTNTILNETKECPYIKCKMFREAFAFFELFGRICLITMNLITIKLLL